MPDVIDIDQMVDLTYERNYVKSSKWEKLYDTHPESKLVEYLRKTKEFILANDGRWPAVNTLLRNINVIGESEFPDWTDWTDKPVNTWLRQEVGIQK